MSRDQKCNFRKFKMADGRHFENSFISIFQPWVIRFRSNLVYRCKFPFPAWKFNRNHFSRRTSYWISFMAISRRLIGRLTRNSEWRWRITCRYRSRDQKWKFPKFMMADGRHFANSFRCLRHSCYELMLSSVFQ